LEGILPQLQQELGQKSSEAEQFQKKYDEPEIDMGARLKSRSDRMKKTLNDKLSEERQAI